MENTTSTPNGVDHLFALVRERYGARLTEAELEEVRKGIAAVEQTGRALRAARIEHSDEPMQPFTPFRGDA